MLRARFYSAFFFLAAIACGDTKSPTAARDAGGAEGSASLGPPGGSIQSAIDAAAAGAIIRISAGTRHEPLTTATPRLTLVGIGHVVIENPGTAEDGIVVADSGDGFALANVTVRGFEENGVKLEHVNGFVLWNVRAENDGEYGLFPVFSSHGVIVHCAASGHSDTGIYVGQSDHIVVVDNVASGNVNGLEIENSSDVLVANNESFDNVAGVLVVIVPCIDDMYAVTNI